MKFAAIVAAQIADAQYRLVVTGYFCGLTAELFVVRNQNNAFLVKMLSGGRERKFAVLPL